MLKPAVPRNLRIEKRVVCELCEHRRLFPVTFPATPDGLRRLKIHLSDGHRWELTKAEIDGITNA